MLYFQDFGTLLYQFGDEEDTTIFQDISRYADVIDQVKDDISFLNYHTIQEGFRPDQVSLQLYNSPNYYWTIICQSYSWSAKTIRTTANC